MLRSGWVVYDSGMDAVALDQNPLKSIMDALESLRTQVGRVESAVDREVKVMRTWVFQDAKQVAKVGDKAASWYVGWVDPDGKRRCKSCGPGSPGKATAGKLARKINAELLTDTYGDKSSCTWAEFREEYDRTILPGLAERTREEVTVALDHFERLTSPARMRGVTTSTINGFIAARRKERGKQPGSTASPQTVNKGLRHLKAALEVARQTGYLRELPIFRMEKTLKRLPRYVTPEHFAAIYAACETAQLPIGQPYPAATWWRGLLVMAYMTGWRISELLALKRADLDLDSGVAVTRAEDNKGKRDEAVGLHDVVIEHLRQLPGFTPSVLPWIGYKRQLYDQFHAIQAAAGVSPHYGFHDYRRAFATQNARRMTSKTLQKLMRHKSASTTAEYINSAEELTTAVADLHVPEVLRRKAE